MKRTKLQGYLKDLENNNKNFSFKKTMRLLDVGEYIFLDVIKDFQIENLTTYKKSKYIIEKIKNQFEIVYDFLDKGKILIAVCLLRNIFEELMYIIATSLDIEIDLSPDTKAGYFKDIVINNIDKLLSDNFDEEDIREIYKHLSKLVHVTNLKEATSYLASKNKYSNYISNEIKFLVLMIQYIYIDFYNKRSNITNIELCTNIFLFSGYCEFINELYFVANLEKEQVYLKKYFYGERNQNYLSKKSNELKNIVADFKIQKNSIEITVNKLSKELNKQIRSSKYFEQANKIIIQK